MESLHLTLIAIAIILTLVIIVGVAWPKDLLRSSIEPSSKGSLLGIYYLPETILAITVRVKILMEIDSSNSINSTKVISQEFKISRKHKANYQVPIYLNYFANPFADEKVELKINKDGLLTDVEGSSDNRLEDIFFSLTDFNSELNTGLEGMFAFKRKTKTVRILERSFVNTFEISVIELLKQKTKNIPWDITMFADDDLDISTQVSANFSLNAKPIQPSSTTKISALKNKSGIVFPLEVPLDIEIRSGIPGLSKHEFNISAYHSDNYFLVPIKTTPFAHRKHVLKILEGKLKSHSLDNPSSISGLANIPVRMAKSVMSIPAELFSIRIGNFRKKAELEKLELAHKKEIHDMRTQLLKSQNEHSKTKNYLNQLRIDSNKEIDRLNELVKH